MRTFLCVAGAIAALGSANAQQPICTNDGKRYSVGEVVCVAACHGRQRLARCDIVSNAATWTYLSDSCPSAMIPHAPLPDGWWTMPAAATSISPIPVKLSPVRIAAAG